MKSVFLIFFLFLRFIVCIVFLLFCIGTVSFSTGTVSFREMTVSFFTRTVSFREMIRSQYEILFNYIPHLPHLSQKSNHLQLDDCLFYFPKILLIIFLYQASLEFPVSLVISISSVAPST